MDVQDGFWNLSFLFYSEAAEVSYKGNTKENISEKYAYSLLFLCNYTALDVTSVILTMQLYTCIAPVPSPCLHRCSELLYASVHFSSNFCPAMPLFHTFCDPHLPSQSAH